MKKIILLCSFILYIAWWYGYELTSGDKELILSIENKIENIVETDLPRAKVIYEKLWVVINTLDNELREYNVLYTIREILWSYIFLEWWIKYEIWNNIAIKLQDHRTIKEDVWEIIQAEFIAHDSNKNELVNCNYTKEDLSFNSSITANDYYLLSLVNLQEFIADFKIIKKFNLTDEYNHPVYGTQFTSTFIENPLMTYQLSTMVNSQWYLFTCASLLENYLTNPTVDVSIKDFFSKIEII